MNVSPQNVLEILDAADSMQIGDMKGYALELIVQNFAQVCSSFARTRLAVVFCKCNFPIPLFLYRWPCYRKYVF